MSIDQALKAKITEILYRADPEGLTCMQVPARVYSSEAEIILDRLAEVRNVDDLANLVARVYRNQFGHSDVHHADGRVQLNVPDCDESEMDQIYAPEKFRVVAAEIWSLVND